MQPYLCYVLASNEQDARGRERNAVVRGYGYSIISLVASGQNAGEGIPMLVSGGRFWGPFLGANSGLVRLLCNN